MIHYLVTFALSICFLALSLKTKKNKILSSVFWILAIIIPCLLAALRGLSIGTDVYVYQKNAFMQAQKSGSLIEFLSIRSYSEPLYYSNTWLCAKLFNIQTMFFINELLVIMPIFLAFRIAKLRDKEQILGAIIFYFFLYNCTLNMARQSISLSLCVLAYSIMAYRKSKKKGMLMIILASLFHKTAIFFFALMGIYYFIQTAFFKKHKKSIIICTIIALLAITVNFSVVIKSIGAFFADTGNDYQKYTTYVDRFEGAGFLRIDFIYSVLLLLFSYISIRGKHSIRLSNENTALRVFGICCIPGWFVNMVIRFSYRIFLYFEYPFLFLEIPKVPSRFKENKNKMLMCLIIVLLSIGYWFIKYIINNSSETYPYVFYWQ